MCQNTRSHVSLAKIGPLVWRGHYPEEKTRLWCRWPSWIFKFLFFEHTTLLCVGVRLCMPNFVMIGLTAQKLLVLMFSVGNALKVPQNWVFCDFRGWKFKNLTFWTPKGTSLCQNTRLDVLLVQIGRRVWPERYSEKHKKLRRRRPSWIFKFLIFEHTTLLGVRIGLCIQNFVMIGLTAQKLLVFMFSIGNALKVPPKWGFWRFYGWKLKNLSFWTPKGPSLCQNTRFDVLLVQIGRRVCPGRDSEKHKKLRRRRPSWIFKFLFFWAYCTFGGRR